jgi:hypothetical protein
MRSRVRIALAAPSSKAKKSADFLAFLFVRKVRHFSSLRLPACKGCQMQEFFYLKILAAAVFLYSLWQCTHYFMRLSICCKRREMMEPLKELPMGFGMALFENEQAAHRFAEMRPEQKQKVLQQVHQVDSKAEMRALVHRLGGEEENG